MTYDPYRTVPQEFIPTRQDEFALFFIAIDVRGAIRIRHDFRTAAMIAGKIERGLRKTVPPWESEYAKQATLPEMRSMEALAKEHWRLRADAFAQAQAVTGNKLLGKLLHENLFSLFPDIGYSAMTGDVLKRLIKDERQTVLNIFHPLGVEDNARVINLLIKKPSNFYW